MKQYAVLKKGCLGVNVVREFDFYEDAVAFAALLSKSEDGHFEYFVASNIQSVAVAAATLKKGK